MERIHNVNLQPLASVRTWDTKRINAYKDRIQKHISQLEVNGYHHDEENEEQAKINLQKFKNYKEELKKILEKREHIQ